MKLNQQKMEQDLPQKACVTLLNLTKFYELAQFLIFILIFEHITLAIMVRVISQETFDSVVKENIDDFGLEREEAIKEAISQFESQVLYKISHSRKVTKSKS